MMAMLNTLPNALRRSQRVWGAMLGLSVLLAASLNTGCSTRRVAAPAPVEDRGMSTATVAPAPVKVMPGAENAGKPGYYTVQAGDTLFRIALDNGQHWRDLQAWNNLVNPNLIEVGQVLRVAPPAAGATTVGSTTSAGTTGATATAVTGSTVVSRPLGAATGTGAVTAAPPAGTSPPVAESPAPAPASVGDAVAFVWPAQGAVIDLFDEARNKGVGIAGKLGDPVLAAADGRVVYAGAGLRGYGNLIILKHNNTYLTAYAHNQALLVREDQTVRQGQRIAEMGSSDTDRVKLHFEVRRQGKPVDPLSFLPKR